MTDMTSYESYLHKVLPDVDGCPPIVAEDKIRDAIIEVCQSTSIWRKELLPFYLTANVPTYKLIMEDYEQLAQVSWGYLLDSNSERIDLDVVSEDELDAASVKGWRAEDGTPGFIYMLTPETVRLAVIPDAKFTCVIGIFVKPTQDSFEAPTFLYDQYIETIAYGAKAKLFGMKGRSWYDPVEARTQEKKYNDGVRDIRNAATRSHTRGPKRVQMRPLA